MSWRPDDLVLRAERMLHKENWTFISARDQIMICTGADAMLEAQLPLLKQVYAQLCGVKLEQRRADGNVLDWYSALDESIDKLKPMVMEET